VKSVLLIVCALGFGLLPGAVGLPESTLVIVAFPILLGLIYFVFWRHDWTSQLGPWLFACIAVGRVAAYWWLNSRHGRSGALVDQDVWICGGLAVVSFAFRLYKWMRSQSETPGSPDPKSAV
jgi:hypothetical protein